VVGAKVLQLEGVGGVVDVVIVDMAPPYSEDYKIVTVMGPETLPTL
jgi:hypothetical protein